MQLPMGFYHHHASRHRTGLCKHMKSTVSREERDKETSTSFIALAYVIDAMRSARCQFCMKEGEARKMRGAGLLRVYIAREKSSEQPQSSRIAPTVRWQSRSLFFQQRHRVYFFQQVSMYSNTATESTQTHPGLPGRKYREAQDHHHHQAIFQFCALYRRRIERRGV